MKIRDGEGVEGGLIRVLGERLVVGEMFFFYFFTDLWLGGLGVCLIWQRISPLQWR